MTGSNKGDHPTGIVYGYHVPDTSLAGSYRGDFETRHEAIGHAAVVARILGADEYDVRWHESMWTEHDDPVVCGYCGYEDWYSPQVGWTYAADCEDSPFCSRECWARYWYERDRTDRLEVNHVE